MTVDICLQFFEIFLTDFWISKYLSLYFITLILDRLLFLYLFLPKHKSKIFF